MKKKSAATTFGCEELLRIQLFITVQTLVQNILTMR